MPYHYGTKTSKPMKKKKKKMKKKKKQMVLVNSIKKFTPRQRKTMNNHARHHSLKHMKEMAKDLKSGKTFAQAHTRAMQKVGR